MPGMGVDKLSLHWNAFYFSEWNNKCTNNFSMISGLVEVCRHFSMGISLHLDYQQDCSWEVRIVFLFLVNWEGCDQDSNIYHPFMDFMGSPGGISDKEPICQCKLDLRNVGLIPGLRRSPVGGCGNPLQYSCLKSPIDSGAWQAAVHRVAQSRTQLKQLSAHTWITGIWTYSSLFCLCL